MREAYVAAVGLIPMGRHVEKGIKRLTADVVADLFGTRRSPSGICRPRGSPTPAGA